MDKYRSESASIINYVIAYPGVSARAIYDNVLDGSLSYSTLQRILRELISNNYITTIGSTKSTKYEISASYQVIHDISPSEYFKKEIDERNVLKGYNHNLIRNILIKIDLFTPTELTHLKELQEIHSKKISGLSREEYKRNLEIFSIDLSWKSAQIEGNTYTLLETERLLKNKETAEGKTADEAIMLLNHKEAIDFLIEEPPLTKLSLRFIEEIHSILVKGLEVERNIRKKPVSISGTNYRPLDNEFQIKEAIEEMCALINLRNNPFERSLLVLLLISYIQPFMDGNKRTARIAANALLWGNRHCPISFRTVNSLDYKKAMLIFYEQNNISAFKKIFIQQFEFAVNNYF